MQICDSSLTLYSSLMLYSSLTLLWYRRLMRFGRCWSTVFLNFYIYYNCKMHFCQEENAEKVLKTRTFWTKYGLKNCLKCRKLAQGIPCCIPNTGLHFAQFSECVQYGLRVRTSKPSGLGSARLSAKMT